MRFARGRQALAFWAKYLAFVRWLFHGQFSGQDAWMISVTDAPPERLYRPDVSLLSWRRMVEREARRGPHEEELLALSGASGSNPKASAPTSAGATRGRRGSGS